MKKSVAQAIAHITEHPEDYKSIGNSEFSGFTNGKYIVRHAGNNIFFFGVCSVIAVLINDTQVNTSFSENRELEKVSKWWWHNAPEEQLGIHHE